MGWLSSIGNFFSDPTRAVAAASTLGGSEIARAVGGTAGDVAGTAFNPVGAAANKASGIGGAKGVGTSPTPVPQGPPPDIKNFSDYLTASPAQKPGGVSFGPSLSSKQQRSQIATGGVAGQYATPEVKRYYSDLALRSLTDESGAAAGEFLPIEKQFLEQVFGVRPRNESTASFLSALLRSDGGSSGTPSASSLGSYLL